MLNQRELLHLQEKWWDDNQNREKCDENAKIDEKSLVCSLFLVFGMLALSLGLSGIASGAVVGLMGLWEYLMKKRSEKEQERRIQRKKLPPLPVENDYVDVHDNVI